MLPLSRHGGPHPWVKFLKFLLILRTIRKVSRTSVILRPMFHYRVVNWGRTALTIISLATVTLGLRTHSFKSKPSLRSTLGQGGRAQQVTYTPLYNVFPPYSVSFSRTAGETECYPNGERNNIVQTPDLGNSSSELLEGRCWAFYNFFFFFFTPRAWKLDVPPQILAERQASWCAHLSGLGRSCQLKYGGSLGKAGWSSELWSQILIATD